MTKYVVGVLVGLLMFAGGARLALALPTGCDLDSTSRSVSAHCDGGTGYYRARGKIRWTSGAYSYIYGAWTRPGGFGESYANAPSGATVVAAYLDVKS